MSLATSMPLPLQEGKVCDKGQVRLIANIWHGEGGHGSLGLFSTTQEEPRTGCWIFKALNSRAPIPSCVPLRPNPLYRIEHSTGAQ